MTNEEEMIEEAKEAIETALDHPLFQGAFRPELFDVYSWYQFPFMCFNYFLIVYFMARTFETSLSMYSTKYATMSEDKRRIVVTYFMQILVTTVIFIFQIYYGWDLLVGNEDSISHLEIQALLWTAQALNILYIWELIYRLTIGIPLLIHHLCTVLIVQLSMASLLSRDDSLPDLYFNARLPLLLCFHATTEQTSFIALLLYRFEIFEAGRKWFYAAVIQSVILKTTITSAMIYVYATSDVVHRGDDGWDEFWQYAFIPLVMILYIAQLYACYIMYRLALKCTKTNEESNKVELQGRDTTPSSSRDSEISDETNEEINKVDPQKRRSTIASINLASMNAL